MATPDEQRRYQREWIAARRAAWFADKSCLRCASTTDLELDHRDPNEKVDHNIWSWSAERRKAELAKCQVLCEPCHKWKTAGCGENALVGESHPMAKYSDAQVKEVRDLVASGMSQKDVGDLMGINRKTIWYMLHKRQQPA